MELLPCVGAALRKALKTGNDASLGRGSLARSTAASVADVGVVPFGGGDLEHGAGPVATLPRAVDSRAPKVADAQACR